MCAQSAAGQGMGSGSELGSGGITFYMNGQSLDALAFRVVRAACFGNIKFSIALCWQTYSLVVRNQPCACGITVLGGGSYYAGFYVLW